MDFVNLADVDNGNNEPESPEDPDGPAGGELSKGMEFFGWVDDGDNTYEVGEQAIFGTSTSQSAFAALKKYILADSSTGSFFPTNVTKFVGIQWCAGNLVVNSSTGAVSCDGATLGNIAQSDGFSVDLGLRVVTADDYPGYRCDGSVPPPPTGPTVTLNLEKKFSGPVPLGYLPQQFTFRVVGSTTDQIVTLTPYTQDSANGSIQLPKGSYTITEIGPSGFVAGDWRPGWYGECKSGSTFATTIKIDDKNIDDGTLYCQVDNQYRPKNKNQTNSGSGNQASGVTPAQVSVTQTNKTSQAVTAQAQTPSVISRVVRTVREAIRR